MDANSLRRVWRLNFEFRAVARRTSSCTRMLSRSSGPRAVPRPRPAIPRPRPAFPQLLPRLGVAARASPGLPQRAIAMGGFGPGRDRLALFTGRSKDVHQSEGSLEPGAPFRDPTRLWEFGAPSLLITARARGRTRGFQAGANAERARA